MCAFFTGKPEQQKLEQFIGKDILTAEQFTLDELETVINLAAYYEDKVKNKVRLYDMDGKVMSSLFFESSTRTRLSFETAMLRLGGNCLLYTSPYLAANLWRNRSPLRLWRLVQNG